MKKITLLIICISSLTTLSFTQINKGTTLLGGDFSFSTQTATEGVAKYKSNGFTFSPVVAKAVKQNKFWGGSVSFSSFKNNPAAPNVTSKYTSYGVGIFYRKYYPVANKFYAFLQSGISASAGKNKSKQGTDYYLEEKNITTGLNFTPGVSIAITKIFYLESGFNNIASLGYQHNKATGYNFGSLINRSSGNFSISSSLSVISYSLYFGFRFMFDKQKK